MRKLALATVALGTALSVAGPGPAAYAIEDGWDYDGGCGFASISDPLTEPGVQTGQIHGSAVTYSTNAEVRGVTLTCTIVVNGHPATSVSGSGTGSAVAGGLVSYAADDADVVGLCSTVAIDGLPPMVDCSTTTTGTGGRCNGTVDQNCDYCSNNGSGSGSNWSECDPPDDANYAWVNCTLWVANFCYVG